MLFSELAELEERYERSQKRIQASQIHMIRLGAKYMAQ